MIIFYMALGGMFVCLCMSLLLSCIHMHTYLHIYIQNKSNKKTTKKKKNDEEEKEEETTTNYIQ